MKRLLTFMIGLALCGTLALSATNAAAQNFLVIGGGSTTGVYYQVALNICKIVNDKLGGKGYNCIGGRRSVRSSTSGPSSGGC